MEKNVSVAKARRILGSLCEEMSDAQVQDIINTLLLLSRERLLYNGSNNEQSSHKPSSDISK